MRLSTAANLVPAYLVSCIVLGGSGQDARPVLVLQLLAVVLLAFAFIKERTVPLTGCSRTLVALVLGALLLLLVQLLPLPPEIWTLLPGRGEIAAADPLLGDAPPWRPLSLTPHATAESVLWLLPPFAILLAYLRLRPKDEVLSAALLGGAVAGTFLAALQVSGGAAFYPYAVTNGGGVGFFANRNFMGTLLLAAIPFAVAFLVGVRAGITSTWTLRTLAAAGLLVVLAGVALNRSLAAALLTVPVFAASVMLLKRPHRYLRFLLAGAVIGAFALVLVVSNRPVGGLADSAASVSIVSRASIWSSTARAVGDAFPVGTGIGSFASVYRTYEDPNEVGRSFVNQAHNDYLQLVLEGGVLGLALLIAFVAWWARQTSHIWTTPGGRLHARAATIASAAIALHSAVDYPLRTTAIAALFAACLAIMARDPRTRSRQDRFDPHAVRHVAIG